MIASISGILAQRDTSLIVITTDGGVGYELHVPLGVFERLPATGARVTLFTELVVREDSWALYGFDRAVDRVIFQRLLGASGFGPRLALALISALSAERTVRAVRAKELAILSTVPGIGKKKAERLVLELHDKFGDIELGSASMEPLSEADESVRALVGLGYGAPQAEEAVRSVLANGATGTAQIIRAALKELTARR